MRLAHLLCDDGITGELWLGALVDAGAEPSTLQAAIDSAGVEARIVAERRDAREVVATYVSLEEPAGAAHVRSVAELRARIEAAGLSGRTLSRASAVAEALARAEASSHGVGLGDVKFHELARPRGVARILAGAVALEELKIDQVSVGSVNVGGGMIEMSHGRFPVPPPAVLHLLAAFTIYGDRREDELTTPSGAAVLAGLAEQRLAIPSMRLERHGRGAVERDGRSRLLTLLIGSVD